MESQTGIRVALATLLAPISWGTTYVAITELLPADRPLFVALMRTVPAGLLLVGVGWWRSQWLPDRSQWRRLVVLAMCNFGAFFPLLIVAIYRLPGGVAASVGGIQPLLVGVITWIVVGRAMRGLDVAVGLVAAFGVAMVVIRPGASIDSVGLLAALGANVSFSAGVVATKRLPSFPDQIVSTGFQMLIAAVALAPISLLAEGPPPTISPVNALGFAYLSVIATGAAFVIWFTGISRLPTQAPPVLGLAAPCTGAALGWLLLGEDLTAIQVLGFATTIGAIGYAATIGSMRSGRQPRLGRSVLARPKRSSALPAHHPTR
ncbi:MAG: DMT family transporter [Actinomycetota bacterium]